MDAYSVFITNLINGWMWIGMQSIGVSIGARSIGMSIDDADW